MATITATGHSKVRTTLYLTQENRALLDRIPRGQKTVLMNKAIAKALEELERDENARQFLQLLESIQPVPSAQSSEQMIRAFREGKEPQLIGNKSGHEQ